MARISLENFKKLEKAEILFTKKLKQHTPYSRWTAKSMFSLIHMAVLGVKILRKSANRFSLTEARRCFSCIF